METGRISDLIRQFEETDGPPLTERPQTRRERRPDETTDTLQHVTTCTMYMCIYIYMYMYIEIPCRHTCTIPLFFVTLAAL